MIAFQCRHEKLCRGPDWLACGILPVKVDTGLEKSFVGVMSLWFEDVRLKVLRRFM